MNDEWDDPLLPNGAEPPWPETAAPPKLKERLLRESGAIIRQRANAPWRRWPTAAALYAAGVACGIGGMWLTEARTEQRSDPAPNKQPSIVLALAPPLADSTMPTAVPAAAPSDSMDPMERLSLALAGASPEEQLILLRDAGDSFLNRGEYTPATACYRRVLTLESELNREPGRPKTADTWLLASLRPTREQGD